MDKTEKAVSAVEKDMQYFDKMVDGAERLIKPWKIALLAAIIGWAITLTAFIAFAYLTPTEIEQAQDFPGQQQEQSIKGAN